MTQRTYDEEHKWAIKNLPPMPVTDLGGRFGWGWRCECGHGHVDDEAQEGAILTCDQCGKQYCCE